MFGRNRHHCEHRHGGRFGGGMGGGPFGGRFGGGMGGPGMRAVKMLASGDLQLIILSLLNEKPRHGYEIIKALEEHSSGIYTPSPGMVYPALTYLEEMGFAEATAEGTKKLYTITKTGDAHLLENRKTANETLDQLARFGRKLSRFQQAFTEDENTAEDFGRGEGQGNIRAEFKQLRDDLKTAIYEKLDSSTEEKRRVLDVIKKAIKEIRGK